MSIVVSTATRNDVRWIQDVLIPSLAAGRTLRPAGGLVKDVQIERMSLSESFMLTICYKIRLTLSSGGETVDDGGVEVYQMVVKITPDVGDEMLRLMCFEQLFHNEIMAYDLIFPTLGWSDEYPKCYYSHNRPDGAAIVLSDFTVDGWRMAHAKVNLSLEHILVAVAELGKLHGTMYAKKHTDRDTFRRLCDGLQESRFVLDHTSEQWDRRLRIGPKRATAATRAADAGHGCVVVPEPFLQQLETVLAETFVYMKRVALRQPEPLAILCHGDFLRNNIAFKYGQNEEASDIPVKALLFDFQTLRYASPMLDLVTFMVNSTGVAVRRQHFDRIFATYHKALCEHFAQASGISQGSADFPGFLNVDTFLREYALYLPFGLAIGASFLPVLHVPDTTPFEEYASRTAEEEIEDAWNRGGQTLDAELRAIVTDMYEMYTRLGLELKEVF